MQVGGSRLAPELAEQVEPALNCRLQQVFGMAEGLLCYTRLDDPETVRLLRDGEGTNRTPFVLWLVVALLAAIFAYNVMS